MIFSVGFVFAEDVNQTDANLEMADNDAVVSAGEAKESCGRQSNNNNKAGNRFCIIHQHQLWKNNPSHPLQSPSQTRPGHV